MCTALALLYFFKSPRPCLPDNVIISRRKARWLIIVLYVALCLAADSIHLGGSHFITFIVTEVRKINGNQITLLTERLKGQCVKFTGHPLSFKTFHIFLLFIFIIIYSSEPRAFPNAECGLAFAFCGASIPAPPQTRPGTPHAAVSPRARGPVPEDSGHKADSVICVVT